MMLAQKNHRFVTLLDDNIDRSKGDSKHKITSDDITRFYSSGSVTEQPGQKKKKHKDDDDIDNDSLQSAIDLSTSTEDLAMLED